MRAPHDSHLRGSLVTIGFLLDNQYVRNPHTNATFKVVLGTGMGLPHSGELSDCAISTTMEGQFVTESNLRQYRIRRYWRYRDDILILCNSNDSCTAQPSDFVSELRRRTFYRLKVEQVASSIHFWMSASRGKALISFALIF